MCRADDVLHALSQFASGTLGRVQRGLGGPAGGSGGLLNVWASWGGEADRLEKNVCILIWACWPGYIFCEQPRISCHCLCELNKETSNEQEEDEE